MGIPREPTATKYFVALLASDIDLCDAVEKDLAAAWSEIDGRSDRARWTASKFYQKEMGGELWRQFFSLAALQPPGILAEIKLRAHAIEDRYRSKSTGGRRINLDPGYLDAFKVVLASTKNAGQRVYLGSGIYGEVTLLYRNGGFHGLEHTYVDYLWPETIVFFTQLRARYVRQLKQLG